MQRTHLHRLILASALVLGLSAPTWGEQSLSVAKPGADSNPPLAKFYAGSTVNVGEFPGTLIRLSCDSSGTSNAATRHESGQDYVLVVQGDEVMHPLFPGTDEVRRQLNSIASQETPAAVYGKYYPSTGAILVSRIMITKPTAVRTDDAWLEHRGVSTAAAAREGLRLAQCASH